MSTREDCKPTLAANLRAVRQWNTLCLVLVLVLALGSLAILAGACVILYHFPAP